MGIKHRVGQMFAILGAICMASGLLYWINGMFLDSGTLAVYNALVYGLIGLVLIVLGGKWVDIETT